MMRRLATLLFLILAAACGQPKVTGATMLPGHNCLLCHKAGGKAKDAPFTVAGTVYLSPEARRGRGVSGATVVITDAEGRSAELETNEAGNFYTQRKLPGPLKAEIRYDGRTIKMQRTVPDGGCAGCHTLPAAESAPGRLYTP